jgi:hypothetical protein
MLICSGCFFFEEIAQRVEFCIPECFVFFNPAGYFSEFFQVSGAVVLPALPGNSN